MGEHVDRPGPLPLLGIGLDAGAGGDAGVGAEQVDATVLGEGRLDQCAYLLFVGDVDAGRPPAAQARHIGSSRSPRPSQRWTAAYAGTVRYVAIRRRPTVRAYAVSSVGQTKMRATVSKPGLAAPSSARTRERSATASQLRITPSASAAASRSIPDRRAASTIGGGLGGGRSNRKRRIVNVGYASSTASPVSARRRKRSTSRQRPYGSTKGTAFQSRTMTCDEAPMPSTNRPGAASASAASLIASRPGPRVNTCAIAVPSRSVGSHAEARA